MSEKRILLASLLKPINDTRLYEKLALSLNKLPATTVHVAGYVAPVPTGAPASIRFHPIFRFRRLSWGRAKAQLAFYRLLLQVKPHLLIVSTHELLAVSWVYCRLHPCQLVYDLQENYALNLRAQQNYPPLLRQLMAATVRGTEQALAAKVAHFLVAESAYFRELPFLKSRTTLIENKYKPAPNYTLPATPRTMPDQRSLRLLFSGTIAELYGVFEAIELATQLHKQDPNTTLTIIGYCARPDTLARLREQIRGKPFITLIGGEKLVPHQQILELIKQSNIGLLPYLPNASTFSCVPTKLYEYMAYALPIVIQENPLWQPIIAAADAGISIDFRKINAAAIKNSLHERTFYRKGIPPAIFWETEEQKLLAAITSLQN
ncbi:glycosyltransferase family 4 protein [Pontibacter qinzhouensis]|uniref:Glycosyltransferase family 4 protein n=1 Tax=Pontibacter qinzhouensis TaxID=2603253 RepID=A0A5C8J2U9_9BACT|nr:glycosyltransferase [Pontibacter qinzhouensis]TXK28410.1 glycosyltransferase family 4 protein [Pontibacter qinzhouensis]